MAKSSEDYTAFIAKELKKGNVKYLDVASLFCAKFRLTRRSFDKYWKLANDSHVNFIQERETKLNEATITESVQVHSNGLKTKSERLMNLQKQADDIQRMLDHNITPDIVKSPKQLEYMEIERKLTYVERATLMKSLRDLQSEISKIEGDYAPTKQDVKLEDTRPSTKIKLNDGTEIEM
jgi:hypothetical protein